MSWKIPLQGYRTKPSPLDIFQFSLAAHILSDCPLSFTISFCSGEILCKILAGGTPAMPFKDAIVKKLGSQHSAELMMNQVGTAGKSEGLIYNFDGMMFGDTEDAHTLLVAARKAGIADAVEERFYHGSITEGRSLFDRQQLVAMAVEAGMEKADAEAALENDDFRATVSDDEAHAQSIGLSGVPVFVMNEKYAISGAQGADNFLNALRQVWDEQQTEFSATAGQTCGTDGCSI